MPSVEIKKAGYDKFLFRKNERTFVEVSHFCEKRREEE